MVRLCTCTDSRRVASPGSLAAISRRLFATQSNLYRKDESPSSPKFLNEFADPLLKFVASAPEGGERPTFASGIYRIVDTPMQSPGGAGKDGTSPIRVIAYRNYVIEFISEQLVDGL